MDKYTERLNNYKDASAFFFTLGTVILLTLGGKRVDALLGIVLMAVWFVIAYGVSRTRISRKRLWWLRYGSAIVLVIYCVGMFLKWRSP